MRQQIHFSNDQEPVLRPIVTNQNTLESFFGLITKLKKIIHVKKFVVVLVLRCFVKFEVVSKQN